MVDGEKSSNRRRRSRSPTRRAAIVLLPAAALMAVVAVGVVGHSAAAVRWIGGRIAPAALFGFACDGKAVALTIDDGPDPDTTSRILKVLARHGVTATFFVTGTRAAAYPDVLAAIVEGGHELGNHAFDETPGGRLSASGTARSLTKTHLVLAEFTRVRWYRPPAGQIGPGTAEAVRALGYGVALADVYPLDHLIPVSRLHSWYIAAAARPGSIIALHDVAARGARTARTLDDVVPALQARGYRIESLSGVVEAPECLTGVGARPIP